MRAEIREKTEEIVQLTDCDVNDVLRNDLKKVMKLSQRVTNLVQKLNIRAGVVPAMIDFYRAATQAKRMGIPCKNDPVIYKQEALKYAKMFGDDYLYYVSKY